MAILVIWSSPNTDGLTAASKHQIIKGIQAAGKEVDEVHLNHMRIDRCLACGNGWGNCQAAGSCILPDAFETIYNKMRSAEGIVFVTPVYWHDLSENLKSFLDRLRRCETAHNHDLVGKTCMLVACAGGSGLGAIPALDKLEQTLDHMKMEAVERLPIIQFNKSYMLEALIQAGSTFARSIPIQNK